ncbi:hypothetical protein [Bacillus sp. 37MA]|uniref:hypothetical protein n=1 Tax=Bacillus sp. 37MA TaxID=1132442 RepID=UPI00036752CE|nr:hypothetical protein [Bacillus sp. 37MA]
MTDLQRMRQEIEEWRREHPEQPLIERIATAPHMLETYERIDKTVRPVLIRYAILVYESGSVQPIDTAKLEALADELEPIKFCDCSSLSTKARVLQASIRTATRHHDYEAPELSRRLYMWLEGSEGRPVC